MNLPKSSSGGRNITESEFFFRLAALALIFWLI